MNNQRQLFFKSSFFQYSIATLLTILLLPLNATKAQETTQLLPFNTVKIMGLIEVNFVNGEEEKIEIKSFGSDGKKLKVSQQNNTLKLSTLKAFINEDLDIRVTVYYKDLEAVTIAGGAKVEFEHVIVSDEFYIRAGSGSEVYLEVDNAALDAQAAEGAHLTIRGKSEKLKAGANTGGILDGHRLECNQGRLRAGTGGEVSAKVNGDLDARANTGGIIRYAGNPTISSKRVVLGGEISKLQRK